MTPIIRSKAPPEAAIIIITTVESVPCLFELPCADWVCVELSVSVLISVVVSDGGEEGSVV